jgi:hypothetical protein
MPILKLLATLGLDGRQFKAGIREAEVAGAKFASGLKTQLAGAFSAAAAIQFGRTILQNVQRLKDLGEVYDQNLKKVQQYDFAAIQSGQTATDVFAKLDRLEAFRARAGTGDEKAIATLRRLGVTYEDIQNPLLDVTDLFERLNTEGARSDWIEIFGRGGGKMIAVLRDLREFRDKTPLIDEEDIRRIDEATKKLERFGKTFMAVTTIAIADAMEGFKGYTLESKFFGLFQRFKLPSSSESDSADPTGMTMTGNPGDYDWRKSGIGETEENLFTDERITKEKEMQRDLMEKIWQIEIKTLSIGQQREKVESRIRGFIEESEFFSGQGFDEFATSALGDAAKALAQLQGLESSGGGRSLQLNELQKIGGQAGQGQELINLERTSTNLLRSIDAHARRLVENSQNNTAGTIGVPP